MVAGLPPFYDKNINQMYKRILNDQLAFPSFMTQECRALVSEMLNRSPEKRIKATQIRQHAFFSCYDWNDVLEKKVAPLYIPDVHGDDDTSHVAPAVVALPPPQRYGVLVGCNASSLCTLVCSNASILIGPFSPTPFPVSIF
jgi:serine/threonine protein kinase